MVIFCNVIDCAGQSRKKDHPRLDFRSPSPFFAHLLRKPTQNEDEKTHAKAIPFTTLPAGKNIPVKYSFGKF
jgi:hypothetical protein